MSVLGPPKSLIFGGLLTVGGSNLTAKLSLFVHASIPFYTPLIGICGS
jgi:hypothetical protein